MSSQYDTTPTQPVTKRLHGRPLPNDQLWVADDFLGDAQVPLQPRQIETDPQGWMEAGRNFYVIHWGDRSLGIDWNEQILVRLLGVDGSYPSPPDGLDVDELVRTAEAIEAISPPDLLAVVLAVPVEWGTSDSDLEAMAWFLYLRRRPVARRIRSLALTLTSPSTGTST